VPSAQVNGAVLLAGLQASGRTIVRLPGPTRDHTERALAAFGARVEIAGLTVAIEGRQPLQGLCAVVPGDVSSACFWAVAAAALPGSDVELMDVGLNPTRTAVLEVLRRAGARVDVVVDRQEAGEPVGRVRVRHAALRAIAITPAEVPSLIDELPVLAALATFGGEITVTGASELRVKESDRITALVAGLRALGADARELRDGFQVRGHRRLTGGAADATGDHRLAMAFAVAALGAEAVSTIGGAEAVDVSYPGFFSTLRGLCA
jgi:3-phosphoshikimate 1-carboxyvinyltransferase